MSRWGTKVAYSECPRGAGQAAHLWRRPLIIVAGGREERRGIALESGSPSGINEAISSFSLDVLTLISDSCNADFAICTLAVRLISRPLNAS